MGKTTRLTTKLFADRAIKTHGNKYDYTECDYKNKRTKVKIICHKKYKNGMEHGEFWQTTGSHLNGNGCPHCRNSHLENYIHKKLISNNINFKKEETFEWLINKGHMYLDFYLPDYSVAIECQGIQHFEPLNEDNKKYEYVVANDKLKKELCEKKWNKNFIFY